MVVIFEIVMAPIVALMFVKIMGHAMLSLCHQIIVAHVLNGTLVKYVKCL